MNTKNLPLIVAIALPVIFIIIISAVVFLPSLSVKPAYDFIYSHSSEVGNYPYGGARYRNVYKIADGRITFESAPPGLVNPPLDIYDPKTKSASYTGDFPPLYRYDVKAGASRVVTLEEARRFVLDAGPSSPDGYSVSYNYGRGNIFEIFGSNRNNGGYFISKGGAKKRIDGLVGINGVIGRSDYYGYDGAIKIIGWIK